MLCLLKLLFTCVWVGMHMAALCCHLAEGRKHVTGFSAHAFERKMHRARAEAAFPAFCRLGSFSPMEIHAHVLQGSFGSDSSAKTEGEKCWKAELLGRAQMDASAELLPETPVPAASSFPLFSFPQIWVFCAAAFEVEVSASQVCLFCVFCCCRFLLYS